MSIGKSIKILRITKDIKQREFAKMLDVTPNYISMIENGSREPSFSFLKKISEKLSVPLNLFLLDFDLDQFSSEDQNTIFHIKELIYSLEIKKIKNSPQQS